MARMEPRELPEPLSQGDARKEAHAIVFAAYDELAELARRQGCEMPRGVGLLQLLLDTTAALVEAISQHDPKYNILHDVEEDHE